MSAARAVALGAAALVALALASCAQPMGEGVNKVAGQMQELARPNARDVELARQMGAPDEVIERLERGEWPQSGAKRMIDFAEEALAYAQDSYGLECTPVKADNPGLFSHVATVTLRIAQGEHEGEEFWVDIDTTSSDHTYKDSLYWNYHHEEFERACTQAMAEVLADLPDGTFAHSCFMSKVTHDPALLPIDQPLSSARRVACDAWVNLSPSIGLSEADLKGLMASLKARLSEIGPMINIDLYVFSAAPPDGLLTDEFVSEVLDDYETYGDPYSYTLKDTANPMRGEADVS